MRYLFAVPIILLATSVSSEPFNECPTQAYLTQGTVSSTYSINLITGDYQVSANNMGVDKSVNALGFNPNDRFIYGWSYSHGKPVRVHSDFQVEVLNVNNITDNNFYTGDVSSVDNKYYVHRRGNNGGLFSIDLDSNSANYLKMVMVADADSMDMRIADMAFHPNTNFAYAVDWRGDLYELDVTNGVSNKLANVGVSGTFGAAYFDVDGNLYISRNNDGAIFKIAIDSGEFRAAYFAAGPASNINDGSRCAQAPLIGDSNTNLDFGDAPDSYQTSLANNGARHGLSHRNKFYLGQFVDGESDASINPLSDETNGDEMDDDGVQFATIIRESSKAIAVVNASADEGYLNAWIDLDRNGTFDENDHVLQDVAIRQGKQYVYMSIPAGVKSGDSWARFRFSSRVGLQAGGGAPDGEVEDYKVNLVEGEATANYYPSANGWSTVAFEDNWPHEGDYDMNDLVAHMRTVVMSKNSGITRVNMTGAISAVGAAYHNGFAVRLPGVKRDQVDVDNIEYQINGQNVSFQPLETARDEAIFIITYNLWDYIGSGEFCNYYRTEDGCGSDIQMSFSAQIPMKEPVDVELKGVFDPFLFATPGAWHGGHFVTAPGRSYEVHLKNQAPTEAFNPDLFNEPGDDESSIASNHYFQTAKGMPWAMEIGSRWNHPQEYIDISHAYPYFAGWASSNGQLNKDWYYAQYANRPLLFVD